MDTKTHGLILLDQVSESRGCGDWMTTLGTILEKWTWAQIGVLGILEFLVFSHLVGRATMHDVA